MPQLAASPRPGSIASLDRVDISEPSHAGHRPRVSSLDGLRGLAAFIVMVSHALIETDAPLGNSYMIPAPSEPAGSLNWLLIRTPLHILWAGQEMVLVFFVLSGYVLALPALRLGRRWFDSSYYPRRIVRLYIPAWCALVVGAALHELHRHPVAGASSWLNGHAAALTLSDAAHAATVVDPLSLWAFTPVLWSLSDEVLFSLLLPGLLLLVLFCARRRSTTLLAAVACLASAYLLSQPGVIAAIRPAWVANDARYMPVFVLGSLLALSPIRPKPAEWTCVPAAVAAICVLTSSYLWKGRGMEDVIGSAFILDVVGAIMVVWVVATYRDAKRILGSAPMRWLGSRSFSLYLVHEPIVAAVAFMGARRSTIEELAIAVPVCLLASELFWRAIERPTIHLARLTGDVARMTALRVRSIPETTIHPA